MGTTSTVGIEGSEPLRVGVVGLGRWGKNLLRDLQGADRCRVTAICDRDAAVLSDRAAGCPSARPTTDSSDLISDPSLDAVVIATGGGAHARLAREALRAGKHVFVEKPPALCTVDARELKSIARRRGLRLMVGHVLHHHPAVAELCRHVSSGGLGVPRRLDAARVNPEAGPGDDDPWWALAPHDISVACRLFGEDPVEVRAQRMPRSHGVRAVLRFPGGGIAVLRVGFGGRSKIRRLRLDGTGGSAIFDDLLDPALRLLQPTGSASDGAEALGVGMPLAREVQHFVDGVLDGAPFLSGATDAVRVVRVLEAGDPGPANRPAPTRS